MRAFVLAVSVLGAASCGDGAPSRLVSADVTQRAAEGCVVPDPAAQRTRRTWIVREGESLRGIARRVYGNEALWKSIRDANPDRVTEAGAVRAGVELTVPFDGI